MVISLIIRYLNNLDINDEFLQIIGILYIYNYFNIIHSLNCYH